ncbi:excisionase [Altererythrobacter sp. B11]|uniref:helix-turn-helix domain-containing protein n=1 Tax=Altererythrobacter sp. B11 TaxID=2060312 RepID=UPI000DC7395F|nr:helix-turn-helix domain-containing protein [Altererythrobacter sp. B11]BBC74028.1 excisionase [Altererythrobacter sp. B11]
MSQHSAPAALTVRIKDACSMTGISRSKFYELIAAGEVEIVKIRAMTLVPVDSLKKLIESGRQRGPK